VVGRFCLEHESLNFVDEHGWLEQVHDIWVVHLLQLAHQVHGVLVLLLVHVCDVDKDTHRQDLKLRVPLDEDFSLVFG
jgi:hypothetical protein